MAIAEHHARSLQQALQIEKKKRKCGKKLNLADKETTYGQWWGVDEIMEARSKLEEKCAMEEALAAEKVQNKIGQEVKRRQKEQEKIAKALQKDIERQAREEEKAQAAAKKAMMVAAKKPPVKPKRSGKQTCKIAVKPLRVVTQSTVTLEGTQGGLQDAGGEWVQRTSKSGRKITLSLRARQ